MGSLGLLPVSARATAGSSSRFAAPELDPGSEHDILRSLGHGTVTGLSWLGNLLDLPGSSVRDIAALKNPLDQWLPWNMTSSENRTSGRDLAEQYGILKKNKPGLDFGDVLGFGLEVGLDPLTYLSLGGSAITKGAGGLAKSSGALADLHKLAKPGMGLREVGMTRTLGDLLKVTTPEIRAGMWKTAQKQGIDLAAAKKEKLGSLFGVGLPFGASHSIGGTGARSLKVAKALDKAGIAIKNTAPVRGARALFDWGVDGAFTRGLAKGTTDKTQEVAELATKEHGRAKHLAGEATVQFRRDLDEMRKAYDDTGLNPIAQKKYVDEQFDRRLAEDPDFVSGTPEADSYRADLEASQSAQDYPARVYDEIARMYGETGDINRSFKEVFPEAHGAFEKMPNHAKKAMDSAIGLNRTLHAEIQSKGGQARWIEGGIQHFPRFISEKMKGFFGGSKGRRLPTTHSGMQGRDPRIRKIDTHTVNKLIKDRDARLIDEAAGVPVAGQTHFVDGLAADPAGYIRKEYDLSLDPNYGTDADLLRDFPEQAERIAELRKSDPAYADISGKDLHAEVLADWVQEHSMDYVTKQRDLFTNMSLADFQKYQTGAHKVNKSIDAIHQIFRRHLGFDNGTGNVKLSNAFSRAGLNTNEAVRYFAKDIMGHNLDSMSDDAAEGLLKNYANKMVPRDVVEGATHMLRPAVDPTWLELVGGQIDAFNSFMKQNVTVPFPSFWFRNGISGQFVNATSLDNPADVMKYFGEKKFISKLADPSANLTKEERAFLDNMEVYDVVGQQFGYDTGISRGVGEGPAPGRMFDRSDVLTEAQRHIDLHEAPSILNKTPGFQKARKGYQTGIEFGSRANQKVEFFNRGMMFSHLVRNKGWSMEAASRRVKDLQFDYSELAPFEKSVMKRGALFYTFSRKMAGLMLSTLGEKPGGALGQTIRASNQLSSSGEVLPEYLASTLAIPLGEGGDGSKRYISGLGLAHEDPLGFLGGGIKGAALEGLSRLSPIFKAPIEGATGISLFQRGPRGGRPLQDLDPTVGRLMRNVQQLVSGDRGYEKPVPTSRAAEFALSNSPLSRFATTARGLTDPRKWDNGFGWPAIMNAMTGVRISDVSPASQDSVLKRLTSAAIDETPGSASFDVNYFSQENLAEMTPKEREQALQLQAILTMLQNRAKERRAAR